mmetsp:Transcript_15263/g.42365  ORF Transcript_15263/g.42365 Transcript_15263/m.42365 type:complete len:587 (-) Transcript_15263:2584-4344(-)
MVIDRKCMALFAASALATACDAFSFGVRPDAMKLKTGHAQQRLQPLRAFASDKGQKASQYDHFAVSSDPSSPSTFEREVPIASPSIARPSENNKLARARSAPPAAPEEEMEPIQPQESVWERQKAADVQGGSLRTWSFANQHKLDMVQVHMRTDGRPMNANVELWQGPDNVPQKVAIYCEDGRARPFRCFMATPYVGNSISIRNTGSLEYPLQAILEGGKVGMDDPETMEKMERVTMAKPKICQGGAVITERFEPDVQSVQLFLQSEGRPLQCRIELIQGPNNVKQVMEVYTEEGTTRPFYAIVQTPGYGTGVIRIVNTSTLEFPFSVTVQPWDYGSVDDEFDAATTGGSPFFEISGGPEGRGIGNRNLRSVGSPTGNMGGMFGSFAVTGSAPAPAPSTTQSQEGGLAGLFNSSPAPAPAPSPTPRKTVKRNMIAPKPPSTLKPEPEPSPIFLENENFAVSSSKSSLSQDTVTLRSTPAERKMASPKKSTPPPEPEIEFTDAELEDEFEYDYEDELEDELEDVDEYEYEYEDEPEIEPEPEPIRVATKPQPSQRRPVKKRYVPPPPPASQPQRNPHVFLDIDPAYK